MMVGQTIKPANLVAETWQPDRDVTPWNELIQELPGASILQTSQWAEVKRSGGWAPLFKLWRDGSAEPVAAALILRRKLLPGLEFWYIPRGPVMDWDDTALRDQVLDKIAELARSNHAVFLKIDPDIPTQFGLERAENFRENPTGISLQRKYKNDGWEFSPQQIQFRNTIWIDLAPTAEELLAAMKQRTRYKVRLAEKKGVTVRRGTPDDFDMLYKMYHETATRDNFIIRSHAYYSDVWNRFYQADMLDPLIAEVEGEAVGAIMLFSYAHFSWYIYGMSRNAHREKMPNYLLQWKAILKAKERGSQIYDLWGAPDNYDESDRMWGVYQFKKGLGGYEVNTPGAWDLPLNKPLYRLAVKAIPAFINRLKKRRATATDPSAATPAGESDSAFSA
jgi:peptidoglycan pentaglycine glycine transferase (the first glycine)